MNTTRLILAVFLTTVGFSSLSLAVRKKLCDEHLALLPRFAELNKIKKEYATIAAAPGEQEEAASLSDFIRQETNELLQAAGSQEVFDLLRGEAKHPGISKSGVSPTSTGNQILQTARELIRADVLTATQGMRQAIESNDLQKARGLVRGSARADWVRARLAHLQYEPKLKFGISDTYPSLLSVAMDRGLPAFAQLLIDSPDYKYTAGDFMMAMEAGFPAIAKKLARLPLGNELPQPMPRVTGKRWTEVMKVFLEHNPRTQEELNALLRRAVAQRSFPILEELIQKGARDDHSGDSLLFEAFYNRSPELARLLIRAGANPKHMFQDGYSYDTLNYALESAASLEMVKLFVLMGRTVNQAHIDIAHRSYRSPKELETILAFLELNKTPFASALFTNLSRDPFEESEFDSQKVQAAYEWARSNGYTARVAILKAIQQKSEHLKPLLIASLFCTRASRQLQGLYLFHVQPNLAYEGRTLLDTLILEGAPADIIERYQKAGYPTSATPQNPEYERILGGALKGTSLPSGGVSP